jgi:hypothetical protein
MMYHKVRGLYIADIYFFCLETRKCKTRIAAALVGALSWLIDSDFIFALIWRRGKGSLCGPWIKNLPPTPSIPSRNYFALISNFVVERV